MPRIYLPLLPLPVLAAIVAVSACSKERAEETTHVIPPAIAYAAAAEPAPPPAPAKPGVQPRSATAAEDAPTADEVKEFERAVRK